MFLAECCRMNERTHYTSTWHDNIFLFFSSLLLRKEEEMILLQLYDDYSVTKRKEGKKTFSNLKTLKDQQTNKRRRRRRRRKLKLNFCSFYHWLFTTKFEEKKIWKWCVHVWCMYVHRMYSLVWWESVCLPCLHKVVFPITTETYLRIWVEFHFVFMPFSCTKCTYILCLCVLYVCLCGRKILFGCNVEFIVLQLLHL